MFKSRHVKGDAAQLAPEVQLGSARSLDGHLSINQLGRKRLIVVAGDDGFEAALGRHETEADMVREFIHAADDALDLNPMRVKMTVSHVLKVNVDGGRKIGNAKHGQIRA